MAAARIALLALGGLIGLLAVVGEARAASVEALGSHAVTFRAGAGESNRLTAHVSLDRVIFGESSAPIGLGPASPGCVLVAGPWAVACPLAPPGQGMSPAPVTIELGDGDDWASIRAASAVRALDDEDALLESGAVRVEGEGGADTVVGSGAADVLDGGPGADRLDGREGVDLVSYVHRRNTRVDLERTGAQAADADGDVLKRIEWVIGGRGSNRLEGDAQDNVLIGLVERDVLVGRGGNDTLQGGGAPDRLDGGPGRDALLGGYGPDHLSAADGERDTVSCGEGSDTARVDRLDRVVGCERVTRVR